MNPTKRTAKLFLVAGWAAMALLAIPGRAEQPCLKTAWANLTKSDYAHAIEAADECIDQFSVRAFRDQSNLQASGEKVPPTGAVDSPADRKKIFERWAVNDIATAYFVKAQAAEKVYRKQGVAKYKQMALDAYRAASKLTYGRCWDPQGWFWSPAEAATDRLGGMGQSL